MMRLPRCLPGVVIACCSVALPAFSPVGALAQEAAATKAVDPALKNSVDAFWHDAKTFRYDAAAADAKRIIDGNPDADKLLAAFEAIATERNDNLDQWMLRWQQVPQLREGVDKLLGFIRTGYANRRADQNLIEENIKRLPVSEQSYLFAIARLRDSGELALPLMVKYLRDPAKQEYHAVIKRAIVDLGRSSLAPLLAAVEMPANERNLPALLAIENCLGQMGYDLAIPPLAKLAATGKTAQVQQAATEALLKMGAGDPRTLQPSTLYFQVAERYYYGRTSISAQSGAKVSSFWMWDDEKELYRKDVPTPIYNDLLAMRAARQSLVLQPAREDSTALWLCADYGREVNLPQGEQDPTMVEGTPSAHYYGVGAGTKYLNLILQRTLKDHDTAVALKALRSLQQIAGQSNLIGTKQTDAVVKAMQYPDRIVRFDAALALAAAIPQTPFEGQDHVVPILAEALVQTGEPYVLIVGQAEKLDQRMADLQKAGYIVAGVANAKAAAQNPLPAVDAIVITDEDAAEVETLLQIAASNSRLQGSAILVLTKSNASPYSVAAATNQMLSVANVTDVDGLKAAIESARKKSGTSSLDKQTATDYALKASSLLAKLAIARGQVLDVSAAQTTLLQCLNDARPELVKSVAITVSQLHSQPAQSALLAKAADAKTDDQLKLAAYNALATSAKFFGNMLNADEIATLQQAVVKEKDLNVRAAAAEAHGALSLPPDDVEKMLLGLK